MFLYLQKNYFQNAEHKTRNNIMFCLNKYDYNNYNVHKKSIFTKHKNIIKFTKKYIQRLLENVKYVSINKVENAVS